MGQRAIDNFGIIDETFASLQHAKPIEMGRPDIEDERPGTLLVEAVRQFAADGGFQMIREERDRDRAMTDAPDQKTGRDAPVSISLPSQTAGDRARDHRDP